MLMDVSPIHQRLSKHLDQGRYQTYHIHSLYYHHKLLEAPYVYDRHQKQSTAQVPFFEPVHEDEYTQSMEFFVLM